MAKRACNGYGGGAKPRDGHSHRLMFARGILNPQPNPHSNPQIDVFEVPLRLERLAELQVSTHSE
jgi:hypothetical protein